MRRRPEYRHGERADFWRRRRMGWGRGLYRDRDRGWIGGVAAGLAASWDIAPWVVRLLWFCGFVFTGSLAVWAYIAAWCLLGSRPRGESYVDDAEVELEYDEQSHRYRPRRIFRYSEPAAVRLARANKRLDAALARVEAMERYVTSRQYRLREEISRL